MVRYGGEGRKTVGAKKGNGYPQPRHDKSPVARMKPEHPVKQRTADAVRELSPLRRHDQFFYALL